MASPHVAGAIPLLLAERTVADGGLDAFTEAQDALVDASGSTDEWEVESTLERDGMDDHHGDDQHEGLLDIGAARSADEARSGRLHGLAAGEDPVVGVPRGARGARAARSDRGREPVPLPTENVGSLPRPQRLQDALQAYDAGRIDRDALAVEQDAAVRDAIARMEATGQPLVSDGEQRASSFATYPLTDTLGGSGLADTLDPDGKYFAIFDDGHHRQLPRLVRGPFRYTTFAGDLVAQARSHATKPLKQAVIAPSMLMLLYPLDEELSYYPRERFLADLVDQCEQDIRSAFAAGAVRVSIDFTEGRLAHKNDARNPWTGRDMLDDFLALINRVLARFSTAERADIGVHTCPGGDRDSTHSADVPYDLLLSRMFTLDAGYFLIQCASETDREEVYRLVGAHRRDDANGVSQTCFMGVVNPLDPRVEEPEEIRDELLVAAQHIPPARLGATDDCGFSPFSIDEKPGHGSPDVARDVAFEKIAARVAGAQLASEALGV